MHITSIMNQRERIRRDSNGGSGAGLDLGNPQPQARENLNEEGVLGGVDGIRLQGQDPTAAVFCVQQNSFKQTEPSISSQEEVQNPQGHYPADVAREEGERDPQEVAGKVAEGTRMSEEDKESETGTRKVRHRQSKESLKEYRVYQRKFLSHFLLLTCSNTKVQFLVLSGCKRADEVIL